MGLNPIFYQLGLSAGFNAPTPDFGGTYVMHPEFELLYNQKGSIELCRPEKTYLLTDNTLILFWGMVPYTIRNVSAENKSSYVVFPLEDFYGDLCLQRLYQWGTKPLVQYCPKLPPRFEGHFSRWVHEVQGQNSLKAAALLELKAFLYRWDHLLGKDSAVEDFNASSEGDSLSIQKIFLYLFKNISTISNEAELARSLKIHPKTLRRRFYQVTGMTVRKYLMNYRMNQAINLIQKNRRSISYIWSQLGFQSAASFYRNFKAYFGRSPDYFRANQSSLKKK